jgi:predicted Ser/Thr protein kinase
MPEALRCAGCGSELAADAPEGLCPACLLKQAMQGGSPSSAGPSTTAPRSPGPAFEPPRPEDLAPDFPQLEILERLGRGGMGVVYKARQLRLDRLVALKILPPELGRDPAFAERFQREARALARLTHPRIVGVHDFGAAGGAFYLVMEFVDGVNLRSLLDRGRLQPDEALRIVPQICEALQYAHEEGVVHRDIKPENILLDRRGNVKIADFGLAKLLGTASQDSALTGSRQVMGTLRYMAPEQMERPLAVDHRADIYSLGVVFYEMLTGELPMGRFDPPSKKVQVDVRLDEVVRRALEKEPERRYQHASDIKTEVEALAMPAGPRGTGPGAGPNGAASHPGGASGDRPDAWLQTLELLRPFGKWANGAANGAIRILAFFILLFFILSIIGPVGAAPTRQAALASMLIAALAAGTGIWGIRRYLRGDRSDDTARTKDAEGHGLAALEQWRPWPLLGVIVGLSVASLFAPVKRFYIAGSAKVHVPESLSGAELFFADLRQSPSWLTNLLICLGCWALFTRRWLAAGLASPRCRMGPVVALRRRHQPDGLSNVPGERGPDGGRRSLRVAEISPRSPGERRRGEPLRVGSPALDAARHFAGPERANLEPREKVTAMIALIGARRRDHDILPDGVHLGFREFRRNE